MRLLTVGVPVVLALGLAATLASADDHKDKSKDKLKPNEVLMKVPGMH